MLLTRSDDAKVRTLDQGTLPTLSTCIASATRVRSVHAQLRVNIFLFDYTHCIIQTFNIVYYGKFNVREFYINCEFANRVL
jgi:hypothetical protein